MKRPSLVLLCASALAVLALPLTVAADPAPVTLSEQDEVIPTYLSGPPDPNPMFYFGQNSQGAEGRIYPYPLYDNLTNQKHDQTYHLVYLENEYVKIGILPEIGGRLFSAEDKTNHYDFVYHQHVIKPALIGLIGAWISGGIEWNIPHHHRASTFLPVQYRTETNADGSKTVWVGELEVRQRMRWAVGYTLHPGSSVLDCSVRILNRTPLENTMLCFANVAVNANPDYQIIFPPDTQWVTFHAKNQFTEWPMAKGVFNGEDFGDGTDVSLWKNHVKPNSMFCWGSSDDFFAGYDHGKNAGTMSIANHYIVPGKKFWTWGSGPVGHMWDDILTDADGPYIELMVGAYSDNQPDYSWLQPFETRAFQMSWYPFRDIGGVKSANRDAAVNLEVAHGTAKVGFYTTKEFPQATVFLKAADKVLLQEQFDINPAKPYKKDIALPSGMEAEDLRASLVSDGKEVIAYAPVRLKSTPRPDIVKPPSAPASIANDEELYLTGQRIDQFHDPNHHPEPYWQELLRRDPGNIEANKGMGLLALRRAKYPEAEAYFKTALARLTAKYTTPKDASPFYYLGVALAAEDKADEAFSAFYHASWSQEWKSPAYFSLAEIAAGRGDFSTALDLVDQSLDANALNPRAYELKSAVLRHLGRGSDATALLALAAAKTDPLDAGLMAEQWLVAKDSGTATALFSTLNQHPQNAQEIAADFADAGLWSDGIDGLTQYISGSPDPTKISPMIFYYLGYFEDKMGDSAKAGEYRRHAMELSPEYVFPFQSEEIAVLRGAIAANPQDARARYYLGNLLFDGQPDEAVALWEQSVALDPKLAVAWRNLSQAYEHQEGPKALAQAISCLEKAISLNDQDPTYFSELDHLYQATGAPVEKRLSLLQQHQATVGRADGSLVVLIGLKTFTDKPDEAIALLQNHLFNIWETGSQINTGAAWANAYLTRGLQHFRTKQFREALSDFETACKPPANLRAQPPSGIIDAEINYWIGKTHASLGETDAARESWNNILLIKKPESPGSSLSETTHERLQGDVLDFYRTLASVALEQKAEAKPAFAQLVASGKTALNSDPTPTDSTSPVLRADRAMAHYVMGLGYSGLDENKEARDAFGAALAIFPDFLDAKLALAQRSQP
jgi:tetratricopeptide (TPR) repeat protein